MGNSVKPSNPPTESTPLLSFNEQKHGLERDDLQAAARIIFFLLTKREQYTNIVVEDVLDIAEVELAAVVLALQKGMTAAEGLEATPFHSIEKKHELLCELSGYFLNMKDVKTPYAGFVLVD